MSSPGPGVSLVLDGLREQGASVVLVEPGVERTGFELLRRIEEIGQRLSEEGIGPGRICAYEASFALEGVAMLLALAARGAVAVPLGPDTLPERERLLSAARAQWWWDINAGFGQPLAAAHGARAELVERLRAHGHPGLFLFSSGSTGEPKIIVHDLETLLLRFAPPRRGWRTILFLQPDHFGGLNTLFAVLRGRSVGIVPATRTPEGICRAIQEARADLLPVTPTFLGVLHLSGIWKRFDLSSVRLVSFGGEPAPPHLHELVKEMFPGAALKQTYGLSELGVLRTSSPSAETPWMQMGGAGFEHRIVDGSLRIRSASAMLGYLNAPTPVDADGWMDTGDLAEEHEGLVRILGRRTDLINVGGLKVVPREVEETLARAGGVAAARVIGVPHPTLGQAVSARVSLSEAEEPAAAKQRLLEFCRAHLQRYKIPMRIELVELESIMSPRGKMKRENHGEE